MIADANTLLGRVSGSGADVALTAGQTVKVPSVQRSTNTANSFQVYQPGELIGSTSPEVQLPPPKGDCGPLGMALVVAVAFVAAIATAGALAPLLGVVGPAGAGLMETGAAIMGMGGTAALGAGGLAAATSLGFATAVGAAVGGAVGSIASQGVAIHMGMQDKFDWKQVGLSTIGAGVSAGLGQSVQKAVQTSEALKWMGDTARMNTGFAATAAMSNMLTQRVAVATGMKDKFDWKAVATSAVAAPVVQGLTRNLPGVSDNLTRRLISGIVTQRVRMAVYNEGKLDYESIAADAFGNALGDSIVAEMQPQPVAGGSGLKVKGSTAAPWGPQFNVGEGSALPPEAGGSPPDLAARPAPFVSGTNAPELLLAADRSTSDGRARVDALLAELKNPATMNDMSRLRAIGAAVTDFTRSQIEGLSPEDTSKKTALAYQSIYRNDKYAVWFGLATYAASKVGESYGNFAFAAVADPANAAIARKGFYEGNRAIFTSMMSAEMVYLAGGSQAVRAMQEAGITFGGAIDRDNRRYEYSLSTSYDLRDQAKAAFASGDGARGNRLLGESLRQAANFEQRVVVQQYWDKPQTVYDYELFMGIERTVTRTMGEAVAGIQDTLRSLTPGGFDSTLDAYMRSKTMVTIDGRSATFNGGDVSKVNQRMPFVFDTANNFMQAATAKPVNGVSAQQRILLDQSALMRNVWGNTSWPVQPAPASPRWKL